MNTRQERKQAHREKALDKLQLSPANKAMALAYLQAETPDARLLETAEAQDFHAMGYAVRGELVCYLNPLRKAGEEAEISRWICLLWAIGKSTAGILLEPWGGYPAWDKERPLRVRLLGKPAAAAMEAELYAWSGMGNQTRWLWELAATEPQTLEAAQALGGTPWDNMKVLIAGILLGTKTGPGPGQSLVDDAMAARQAALVADNNRASLEHSAASLTPADRAALDAYLEKGDLSAPLPALSVPTARDVAPEQILKVKVSAFILTRLLGSASFYGAALDSRLRCAVRMYLALHPKALLAALCMDTETQDLLARLDALLADLPGGEVTMLLYLSDMGGTYGFPEQAQRAVAARCKAAAPRALAAADPPEYMRLQWVLEGEIPALAGGLREQICVMLVKCAQTGGQALRAYLEDTGSLADSAVRLAAVTALTHYLPRAARWVQDYGTKIGWDDFFCRCVVAFGLAFQGRYMEGLFPKDADLGALAGLLLKKQLPFRSMLQLFGALYDDYYYEKHKTALRNAVYAAIRQPAYVAELCETARTCGVFGRYVSLSALDDLTAVPQASQQARQGILAAVGDSSKQVQELLVTILAGHPDWAEDIAALLQSKKAAERLLAVQAAARLGEPLRPALEAALQGEKSTKVADAIRTVLGKPAASAEAAQTLTAEDLAARTLKGGKRRRFQWLLEPPLPAVRQADGTPASEDRRDALLAAYCELGRIGRSDTAVTIAAGLNPADLAALAAEVWERWLTAGAQSKNKWVLAFAAAFGGPAMTPRLQHAIHDWPQHARGAIACDAVTALALSPDPAALLVVDAIARKFKFRQVKTAAAAALANAAKELGITAEELADRIVPDLGFAADGTRVFDYGPRQFVVRLTPALELSITSGAGKAVKSLPAPGKTDDPEKAAAAYAAFKTMKKQIRTTVTAQKARLEAALTASRCWDAAAWQALFVRNPIMRQFAISLIWGVYAEDRLTATFRYMEDGSFNTVDEEEYTLPADARIGLVHPVELDAATRQAWKQQLEDYEITPSIQQLDRPVYPLAPDKAEARSLEDFGGKKLNGLSLSGKLQGLGWYRGSVQDGGGYYTFYREDPALGIGVELNFSGCFVGNENETVTVYDAVFYKAGTVKRGSYCYDVPKDPDILALGQIPRRYYSEIVYQLTRATISSTETDPAWRTKRS